MAGAECLEYRTDIITSPDPRRYQAASLGRKISHADPALANHRYGSPIELIVWIKAQLDRIAWRAKLDFEPTVAAIRIQIFDTDDGEA